jgi:sigma-E factor negative regulatory protein RseB
MNNSLRRTLLIFILVGVSGQVLAGGSADARVLLERMATAMSELSYQGTFVYVRDGVVETMRITHAKDENGVRERLYSVNGPRREVIRDQRGIRCVLNDPATVAENLVVPDSYFPALPQSLFDNKVNGYDLQTGGKARIAGHTARLVRIRPEDGFRFGYDFWLDEETGLLLKWVLFEIGHKALAKLMFTELVIGDEVDLAELESDSPDEDFVALSTISSAQDVAISSTPRWKPAKLPPGFHLTSHSQEFSDGGVFEHTVYSDGLAAVSVYVEKQANDSSVIEGVSQIGTNNAYSTKQNDLQITVLGEVPAVTVKTIADEMARSIASN